MHGFFEGHVTVLIALGMGRVQTFNVRTAAKFHTTPNGAKIYCIG